MRLLMLLVAFTFSMAEGQAQSTWKDIEYKAPASYKIVDNSNRLVFEKFAGKQYCQLVIFPLEQAAGSAAETFQRHWNFFARNASQGVADPETKESEVVEGWTYTFGAARGSYRGQMFAVTISSRYYQGHSYFVATVLSEKQWLEDAQSFMNSVHLTAEAKFASKQPQPAAGANNASVASAIGAARQPLSSTLFNDGWKSTAHDDYVSIQKNGAEVRLIFPDPALDKNRPSNTSVFEPHYWDNVVRKYYQINGQVINKEKPPYSMNEYDIWIAPATDLASGKAGYVAMMLSPNSSGTVVMTVFSADRDFIDKHFAKTADFNRMVGYNKFNATASNLVGEWKNSSGAGIEYYNVYTGASAGMATAHVSDHFVFSSNGTYTSEHTGTSSFQGSLKHGKSNYNGAYTLQDGVLILSGRGGSDSGAFTCYFEAVKAGVVLRLVNKQYTGINLLLWKAK